MNRILAVACVLLFLMMLAGCSSDAATYRAADNKILCEPVSGRAFLVTEGYGIASIVETAILYNGYCSNYLAQPAPTTDK